MTAAIEAALADPQRTIAELRRQLDECRAELAARNNEYSERIAHQSATLDVLKVMSASPGDPQPVFDLIVERARDLCDGYGVTVYEFDGTLIHWRAATGVSDDPSARQALEAMYPMAPTREFPSGRAILDRQVVHTRDMATEPWLSPAMRGLTVKSSVSVPLIRGGAAIGALVLGNRERGGFSDSQVELLKTFAEQAVIAITSAGTYRELQQRTGDLQESLEYQTATSDVLKVISRSTFDLQPVLDTVVETATRLCDAEQAVIFRRDGKLLSLAANFGFPPDFEAYQKGRGLRRIEPATSQSVTARAVLEGRPVHIEDVAAVPGYPETSITLGKQRTSLGVPLLRAGEPIGVISLARQRVEPFTERQIELVAIFADQAVIAIENARLIADTREALEQQTATAEVLGVINSSPGDLAPVFDAMLDRAMGLCEAAFGLMSTYDGEHFHTVAMRGVPASYAEVHTRNPPHPGPETGLGRVERGEDIVHILDLAGSDAYRLGDPRRRDVVDLGGARSYVAVALRKDGALLGTIAVYRQEVRPFSDKQIALLQNFAAQAVIAMENARLITETREALAQQTATAEVLQVINSSPGDLAPVFDAMLEKAMRLCDAAFGLMRVADREQFRTVAARGVPAAYADFLTHNPLPADQGGIAARNRGGEAFVHTIDLKDDERYRRGVPTRRAMVDLGGARTSLSMALKKDQDAIGAIHIYRQEVRPFSDKQIALLQNFAAQAVIAMENARLITETQEALEQQTATAEVLQVINSSPGELAPVFEAVLANAVGLCEAKFGTLVLCEADAFRAVATHNAPPAFAEARMRAPLRPPPDAPLGRVAATKQVAHIADIRTNRSYSERDPYVVDAAELGGYRTVLSVPMLKDNELIGAININRQEVRPFTDRQIALVENFAAQAVIAMENARLITETREALEQQTATAEVLQVINSSPGDLAPVFDAMLERAIRLCDAKIGTLWTYDGEQFQLAAVHGGSQALCDALARSERGYDRMSTRARALRGEHVTHMLDARASEAYLSGDPVRRAMVDLGGGRALVTVSLRKDDVVLGIFTIYRQDVRAFSDKQIALLQNFAGQAVIAIENARLLTETREALEQQTATAEVLEVINSSPGNLAPVFDAMLDKALRLCEATHGQLATFEGEQYRTVAARGDPAFVEFVVSRGRVEPGPRTAMARIYAGETTVHVDDVVADGASRSELMRKANALGHWRTMLAVALRKDDRLLGAFIIYRQEVRPFSDKQIALLQNFAAQAVIAMENARLLTETREALAQQTATAEVLQVINSSPGDLAPVFDAMLEKAMRLCEAAFGYFMSYDGEEFETLALRGVPPPFAEFLRREPLRPSALTGLGRIAGGARLVHVADLTAEGAYRLGDPVRVATVDLGRARTWLAAALMKDDVLLGVFMVYRQEVRPFSDQQIALIQNFADQAVIAMENARLITETREALAQQTATAEILEVINRSPGDLTPVFDAILEKAHSLCGIVVGSLNLYEGTRVRTAAHRGLSGQWAELVREPYVAVPGSPPSRLLGGERIVHIIDHGMGELAKQQPDNPRAQASAEQGLRTALWVPLRKDAELLGYISAFRQEVRPFSEKEIALLESFAAQAVIAIDNARLLNEIRQRQAELRVTFDNMGDGVAMFDSDQRLAAWNLNFQRILDLPDALLAERPSYADYIRFLAERGEFDAEGIAPELSARIEATDQELRLERTRADGRVIEVRRNAVPGGGFVTIYSDVTERKRAELEIHAARDTAERALQELKTTQASLLHAQKMAALGQLTAGIAHEIKNPLNFVNNFAGLSVELLDELKETAAPAISGLAEDERADIDEIVGMLTGNLEKIAEHGRRADGIVKSMLEHSRGGSGERREVDLNGLVEEALNLAYHGARAQDQNFNFTLERDFASAMAPIELVPQDMTRVLLNLFGNGFYAATKRRHDGAAADFRPILKVATHDLGDAVEIRVRDNGTGIAPEIRDKLFQPFFTTKPTGEGTGLGLSISYDIVTQQHGGTIEVDSISGEFTEFTIRLPRTRQTQA